MATPIDMFITSAQQFGITLVLLWVLALAVVWGMLQHANIPKSASARGTIAIAIAFLVLLAAAPMTTMFLENLVTATVLIAVGLLITVMFLEFVGIKAGEGKKLFEAHPKFFGAIILILVVAIFVGAGALSIIGLPNIQISQTVLVALMFLGVMGAAIYIMMKETGEKKG